MRLTALWVGLLVMGAAVLVGPVATFADERGWNKPKHKDSDAATVYEVAEWGRIVAWHDYKRRQATATLVGVIEAGVTLCPKKLKVSFCNLTILASDDVSLTTGRGPVEGDFWIVTQLDNDVDGPEGIILEGRLFDGTIDLSPTLQEIPLGFLAGRWEARGTRGGPLEGYKAKGDVSGTFQLPFEVMIGPDKVAFYMVNPTDPFPQCCEVVLPMETSLSVPTVRLELTLRSR
jgi:hypothetical protein